MIIKNIKPAFKNRTAIISITKNGFELSEKLKKFFPDSDIFFSKKLDDSFAKAFKEYKNIVAIMATGIVVRKIAPFLKSKTKDPSVVVLDEKGNFAISLVSGHLGRANEVTKYIADKINAIPVITTATDINNKFAVDIIPSRTGWEIENVQYIKKINSAFLNNKQIITNIPKDFLIEIFFDYKKNVFQNITFCSNIEDILNNNTDAKIVVSNRLDLIGKCLLFRPKNLYIGFGCNRGTKLKEIEKTILNTLEKLNKSSKSINSVSSFNIKSDEAGLIEFSKKYNIQLNFYNEEELNSVEEYYEPSEYLIKNLGVKGVCEPSAILSADKDMRKYFKKNNLLPKQKIGNVTIAIRELQFI